MEKLTCRMCPAEISRPASGRPRLYCGRRCRRRAEYARRRWDRAAEGVRWAEANAALDGRTEEQITNWRTVAREIETALGPRP